MRFSVNQSSKFSPFFLLFNRDVILPLDTILKPRRKYLGDENFQKCLEQQHKSFSLVYKYLKKAQKRNAKYVNKGRKLIELI